MFRRGWFPFLLLPFYWLYLLFNTQPVMIYDAVDYERLGSLVLHQGWGAYFHTLNREPLFPFLVSRAMALGEATGVPYHYFLKLILSPFLIATMVGIYRLARLLGARRVFAAAGAFYAGMSPALVHATLWLWSEAAALPWAVWGVWFFIKAWRSAAGASPLRRVTPYAFGAVLCFIGLFLVKAVASVVVTAYAVPLVLAAGLLFARRDFYRARAFMLSALIVLGIFTFFIEGYKGFNFRMNAEREVTTRVDWALFGNTVRRLVPLTGDRWMQAALDVPHPRLCFKYYGQACVFWDSSVSDEIGMRAQAYCVARGFSGAQRRNFLIGGSFRLMADHPWQQFALSLLEGSKMLFWENRLFFVSYPLWLERLYNNDGWVYGLSFLVALSGLAGLVGALARGDSGSRLTAGFVICFMLAYSVFFTNYRHAMPIGPLLIVLAVAMVDRVALKARKGREAD
ncbi:MAG: hypothetical protein WCO69_02775 [Candidatus Omnitrophota bacterium]